MNFTNRALLRLILFYCLFCYLNQGAETASDYLDELLIEAEHRMDLAAEAMRNLAEAEGHLAEVERQHAAILARLQEGQ